MVVWHCITSLRVSIAFENGDVMEKVIPLYRWEVVEYFWGTAVRECRTGKWVKAFLRPDGREIDLQEMPVEIHENGIEFLFMPCSRRVHA